MAFEGPEYWYVIYKAVGDFGNLMRDAAEAKAALQGMSDAVKAETAAEVAGSTQAAAARQKDIASIQQETQSLSQLANAAKNTNVQLLYGGRNDMTQHLSDLSQELNYTTLLNRQKWLGFSSVQQAMSYRQQMYNLQLLENRAHFAGYQTADQYLGFLQRETSQTAALTAAIRDRSSAISAETQLLLAHANALQGTRATAGSLGEGLNSVNAYNAALVGLPDTVTTKAVLDDSQAMAQIAAYRAALLGLPHAERMDVVSAATRLGGVPLTPQRATLPVTVRPDIDYASVDRMLAQAVGKMRSPLSLGAGEGPPDLSGIQFGTVYERGQGGEGGLSQAVAEAKELTDDLKVLEGTVVEPHVALDGGHEALETVTDLAGEMKALTDGRKIIYVDADDSDALDDFNYLDSMMDKFAREPARLRVDPSGAEPAVAALGEIDDEMSRLGHEDARPQVDLAGGPEALYEARMLDAEMDELNRHAQARLGVDFSEVEQARLEAEALDEDLHDLPHSVETVLEVDADGAVRQVRDYSRDIEDIDREVGTLADFEDTEAESALSQYLAQLIEAVAHKYEFYAGFNDEEAQAELAGWLSKLAAARAEEKSLLPAGMGGASGGGGGGGPPAGAGGDAPDPDESRAWEQIAQAMRDTETELNRVDALMATAKRNASDTAKAVQSMVDPLLASVSGWYGLTSQLTLFGGIGGHTTSVLHALFDFLLEFVAVFGPAIATLVAGLGSFILVADLADDTLGKVSDRLKAVYTASSATGQAIPPLANSFNKLAGVIRPETWELYGDAVDLANGKLGVIGQLAEKTGNVLDRMAAKIVAAMQSGGKGFQEFIAVGEHDLQGLGEFFSNIGAAFVNFIKVTQETGVDQIFLNFFIVLSQVIKALSELPTPLLAVIVGLHAFYLWGGLATTVVLQLLGPLRSLLLAISAVDAASVEGGLASLGKDASAWQRLKAGLTDIGTAFSALPARIGLGTKAAADAEVAFDDMGNAVVATEGEMAAGAAGTTIFSDALAGLTAALPVLLLGAAAAAVGYFAYKVLTANDATAEWTQSMQKALATTSATAVIGQTVADLAASTNALNTARKTGVGNVNELTGAQAQLTTELTTELTHVGQVGKAYGTDMPTALALLQTAGVKTSDIFSAQGKTWAADLQQVKALVSGYAAMGQGLTQLQGDVSVQLVMNSDQLASMGKLNTAWDSWITLVTSGESAFVTFQQGLATTSTDLKATGASMDGLNANSLTLRGSFLQLLPQAGAVLDSIRNQSAVLQNGAAGTKILTQATKDLAAELIPLAGNNKSAQDSVMALVQEADPAITTWQQLTKWVGPLGASGAAKSLDGIMTDLETPVSQLAADAQKLTTTLQSDLNPAMASAQFNAEGGQKAFNTFATDLTKFGPDSQKTIDAGKTVATMLLSIDKNSTTAKNQFVAWAESMGLSKDAADKLWTSVSSGQQPVAALRDSLAKTATASDNLAKSGFFGQRKDELMANLSEMSTWFGTTLPHAMMLAWNTSFNGFANDVQHPIEQFFTVLLPRWYDLTNHYLGVGWSAVFNGFANDVQQPINRFFTSTIPSLATATGNWFKQTWLTSYNAFSSSVVSPMSRFFTSTLPGWFTSFGNSWQQHWDQGYQAFYNHVWQPMAKFFTGTLPGWFTSYASSWQSHWIQAWQAFTTHIIQPMTSFFTSTVPKWWDSFASYASTTWGKVWSGFQKDVLTPIETFFTTTLPNAMWNSLKGGIDHVIAGLNTVIGWINAVTSIVGVHIGTIPTLAAGGVAPSRMAHGSVPGTGDEDGTHIIAMGGEYVLRKPARMALQAAYGPQFLDELNQADTWLGAGSRGNTASQKPSGRTRGRYAAGGGILGDVTNWLGSAGSAIAGAASDIWHGITDVAGEVAKFGEKAVFDAMWTVSGVPAQKAMEALGTPGDVGASWLQQVHNGVEGYVTAQTAKAQAAQAASTPAAGSSGGLVAAQMKSAAAARGWTGAQWNALYDVEMAEAGFNMTATNPSSGAYGLAQFINGPSEYAQYGGNSTTSSGQITAMLNYIAQRYGTPEAAWAHEQAYHWYAGGGPVDMMASGGPTISGGHVISVDNNDAVIGWSGHDAVLYTTVIHGPGPINGHTGRTGIPEGFFSGLSAGHTYDVAVTPWDAAGTAGPAGTITLVTTHTVPTSTGSGSGAGSGSGSGTDTGSGSGTDTGSGSGSGTGTVTTPPVVLPPGLGTPGPGSGGIPAAGPVRIDLAPLIIGGPAARDSGDYGFTIASGGDVPALSDVAGMFTGGMAAGGVVPNLFVPGLSANLSRQLTAATSGQLPRTLSDAAGNRVGLQVDNLTINNPLKEETRQSITRTVNRLSFLGGRGLV